ncbi:MAG: hypothetical protein ABII27_01730 [bacterium]
MKRKIIPRANIVASAQRFLGITDSTAPTINAVPIPKEYSLKTSHPMVSTIDKRV